MGENVFTVYYTNEKPILPFSQLLGGGMGWMRSTLDDVCYL
jgi:hypothetical protein